MEIEEIKKFFKEFEEIPQEKKDELARFISGVSLLTEDPKKVADLIFSDKDFEEVYNELVDFLEKDENLVEKDRILKKLSDDKELLSKVHTYYLLKKEMSKMLEPFGLYSYFMQDVSDSSKLWAFLAMAIMGNRGFGGSIPSVAEK